MKEEQRLVQVAPFSFWESRTGSGPPVVLIHGLSGSRSWWRHNVAALAAEHLVVTVDLIGFGASRGADSLSANPLTFDDIAGVLARWLESSFDEPVHLIGHSMGGHIAMYLTAHHPELVRSLVLVNSTGMPFAVEPLPHLRAAAARPPRGVLSFMRVVAWDFLRAGPLGVGVAAARILSDDAREAMRSITVPTLLVWGDRDPLVPEGYAEKMAEEIGTSRLVVLPEAGHVAMWDNPEAFNDQVIHFLSGAESLSPESPPPPIFAWPIAGSNEGIAWRASGTKPRIVLVHGLGMPSYYFRRVAASLHARGIEAIAPDLPGFGFSRTLKTDPPRDVDALMAWADGLGLRDLVWLGHSTGCQAVAALAQARPDLVRGAIYASPVWSDRPHLFARILTRMPGDALLEPIALVALAVEAYWEAGITRLLRLASHYVRDARDPLKLSERSVIIAGENDPFAEWELLRSTGAAAVLSVPGAHGVHFSHPEDFVRALEPWLLRWLDEKGTVPGDCPHEEEAGTVPTGNAVLTDGA
jgi:pimeloyl-ACP methyl ester carboxylesterase